MEEERYGPLSAQVARLVAMTDRLDDRRIAVIAQAFREEGYPLARFSEIAARASGRQMQAHEARKDMAVGVMAHALANDSDPVDTQLAARAAGNAGLALATEDLIGTYAYTTHEYAKLVRPWFVAFDIIEGEI